MKTFELNGIILSEEQMKQVAEAYSKPEFEYPIFKRWKNSGEIVKFAGMANGTTVFSSANYHAIGYYSDTFAIHTDKMWEDIAYDKERDLWDGQPVYCWDTSTYTKVLGFYDAINKNQFASLGKRNGWNFDNYKAINPEHYTEWMIQAVSTLER